MSSINPEVHRCQPHVAPGNLRSVTMKRHKLIVMVKHHFAKNRLNVAPVVHIRIDDALRRS